VVTTAMAAFLPCRQRAVTGVRLFSTEPFGAA
jgi:hypothetical protein